MQRRFTMLKSITFIALLTLSLIASAQNPVPKVGNSCPGGTYRSGDYCMPNKSNPDQVIIEKSGKHCPAGFYVSGDYCKRRKDSDAETIPRNPGENCPGGWRQSGDYCVKR
jgi:hypothetical protein